MDTPDLAATELLYYNRWANLQLLDACCALTPEQLAISAPGTYGTIYETLEHLIRAEAGYYRLLTNTRLAPPFSWDDHPSLAEIRPYAERVSSALLDAAGEMVRTDTFIEEKSEKEGGPIRYKPMTLLIQIINHGVEHRTNITTIMAQQGLEPPTIDGWEYMWTNMDRMGA